MKQGKILKQLGLLLAVIVLVNSNSVSASTIIGNSYLSTENGGLQAIVPWNNNTSISVEVSIEGSSVIYNYLATFESKDPSHIILGLCESVSQDDIFLSSACKDFEVKHHIQKQGNPGLANKMYGVKIEIDESSLYYNDEGLIIYAFTIISNRLPDEYDFYVKGGKNKSKQFIYANNTEGYKILAPGCTEAIPEPSTALLGLSAFAALVLRRNRKTL
jgi:hypothetical protein